MSDQKPSILTKEGSEKQAPTQADSPENEHYTVKVSVAAPEMAMLPGGVFVMSLPMNSKVVTKPLALGWALMGVFRIYEIFNDFERLKREHEARKKKGALSLLGKVGAGLS